MGAGEGVPAHKSGLVSDEVEGGDFSDMATEDVHRLGREILWVYKSTRLTLNKTHRLISGYNSNVNVIECITDFAIRQGA